MTAITDRGTFVEHDGRPAVRFVRTYPHPVETVWSALTEPDQLAHWFPSAVEVEHRAGGPHSSTATAWLPVYDAYLADGMPSGAPVPGT